MSGKEEQENKEPTKPYVNRTLAREIIKWI